MFTIDIEIIFESTTIYSKTIGIDAFGVTEDIPYAYFKSLTAAPIDTINTKFFIDIHKILLDAGYLWILEHDWGEDFEIKCIYTLAGPDFTTVNQEPGSGDSVIHVDIWDDVSIDSSYDLVTDESSLKVAEGKWWYYQTELHINVFTTTFVDGTFGWYSNRRSSCYNTSDLTPNDPTNPIEGEIWGNAFGRIIWYV